MLKILQEKHLPNQNLEKYKILQANQKIIQYLTTKYCLLYFKYEFVPTKV